MRSFIRNSFGLLFMCLSVFQSIAGSGSVKPVNSILFNYESIRKLDSILTVRVSRVAVKRVSDMSTTEIANSSKRVCSCQILNLESSNYDHRYVVLLAESNDAGFSAYRVAKARIQKEKNHLKRMFYDKVRVVAELKGPGSCKSMFYQLKTTDKSLQLYEILNADIR
jgi:hypothetical protein